MELAAESVNYYLKKNELKVLLAGFGFERFFGFFDENGGEEDNRLTVITELAGLINEKKATSDGEKITVEPELEKTVKLIGEAERVAVVDFCSLDSPFAVYMGQECVVCERTEHFKDKFRFSVCSQNEIIERIVLSGALPQAEFEESDGDADRLWDSRSQCVFEASVFYNGECESVVNVEIPAIGTPYIRARLGGSDEFSPSYSAETLALLLNRMFFFNGGYES